MGLIVNNVVIPNGAGVFINGNPIENILVNSTIVWRRVTHRLTIGKFTDTSGSIWYGYDNYSNSYGGITPGPVGTCSGGIVRYSAVRYAATNEYAFHIMLLDDSDNVCYPYQELNTTINNVSYIASLDDTIGNTYIITEQEALDIYSYMANNLNNTVNIQVIPT